MYIKFGNFRKNFYFFIFYFRKNFRVFKLHFLCFAILSIVSPCSHKPEVDTLKTHNSRLKDRRGRHLS